MESTKGSSGSVNPAPSPSGVWKSMVDESVRVRHNTLYVSDPVFYLHPFTSSFLFFMEHCFENSLDWWWTAHFVMAAWVSWGMKGKPLHGEVIYISVFLVKGILSELHKAHLSYSGQVVIPVGLGKYSYDFASLLIFGDEFKRGNVKWVQNIIFDSSESQIKNVAYDVKTCLKGDIWSLIRPKNHTVSLTWLMNDKKI